MGVIESKIKGKKWNPPASEISREEGEGVRIKRGKDEAPVVRTIEGGVRGNTNMLQTGSWGVEGGWPGRVGEIPGSHKKRLEWGKTLTSI